MGNFRFYRRARIFPGLTLNLSKSGPSLSIGVRGAHVTVGRRGVTRTVGIPGSGLYYTSHTGNHTGFHSSHVETPIAPPTQAKAHATAGGVVLCFLGLIAVALLLFGAFRLLLGVVILAALASGAASRRHR